MKFFRLKILVGLLLIALSGPTVFALTPVEIFQRGNAESVEVVSNKLMTTSVGYIDQIREGNIPGHTFLSIRGHCQDIGTTNQEMSALGTARFGNWPSAAAGAVVVSTSVQDASGGTGATSITISGLKDTAGVWEATTIVVIPTGTTPTAASAQEFIRIDSVVVTTCGSWLTNVGDITVSIGGVDTIAVYAEHSSSESGRVTVPSDETMYLGAPEGSAVGNKEVTYHVFTRNNVVANSPFVLKASWHSGEGGYSPSGKLEPIPEKTDVVIITHAVSAGAIGSVSLHGWKETD